jgi:hypothetical protein
LEKHYGKFQVRNPDGKLIWESEPIEITNECEQFTIVVNNTSKENEFDRRPIFRRRD